eukprot:TRINITY_DN8330_c0_g1_i1.p1 TRINITY_DN8330_c0_g1~~TRINITY_DN8330_c0_g1_i1.p1  ORF type:complete len:353 (+),score=117.30 TRINITY_DN8330_c0_g1_i1:76-1134(+)
MGDDEVDDFEDFLNGLTDGKPAAAPAAAAGSCSESALPLAASPAKASSGDLWEDARPAGAHADPSQWEEGSDGYFGPLPESPPVASPAAAGAGWAVLPAAAAQGMAECAADCFGGCALAAEEQLARDEYDSYEQQLRRAALRRERAARLLAAAAEELAAVEQLEHLLREQTAAEEAEWRAAAEREAHTAIQELLAARVRALERQRAADSGGDCGRQHMVLLVDGAVVREQAALSSRRVGRLRKGAVVVIDQRRGPRARIAEGPCGLQGWVSVVSQVAEAVCRPATEAEMAWAYAQDPEQLCFDLAQAAGSPPRGQQQQQQQQQQPEGKPDARVPSGVRIRRWGRALLAAVHS